MVNAATLVQRSPQARRLIRRAAKLVNPLVLAIAGRRWMPILGVVHHRGRRTGRGYSTPLGMRPLAGGFVVPRTFGNDAGWYRNLLAAGSVEVTYRGATRRAGQPRLRDLTAVGVAFPRYERALFRLLGIDDFVVLEPE